MKTLLTRSLPTQRYLCKILLKPGRVRRTALSLNRMQSASPNSLQKTLTLPDENTIAYLSIFSLPIVFSYRSLTIISSPRRVLVSSRFPYRSRTSVSFPRCLHVSTRFPYCATHQHNYQNQYCSHDAPPLHDFLEEPLKSIIRYTCDTNGHSIFIFFRDDKKKL